MTTTEKIKELINGNIVAVNDHELKEVQRQIRKIKKNCEIVLSQLRERL